MAIKTLKIQNIDLEKLRMDPSYFNNLCKYDIFKRPVMKYCIDNGASFGTIDAMKKTTLHHLALSHNVRKDSFMLAVSAAASNPSRINYLNYQDVHGNTPVHYYFNNNNCIMSHNLIKFLIKQHCNFNLKNNYDRTSFDLLCELFMNQRSIMPLNYVTFKYFIDKGIYPTFNPAKCKQFIHAIVRGLNRCTLKKLIFIDRICNEMSVRNNDLNYRLLPSDLTFGLNNYTLKALKYAVENKGLDINYLTPDKSGTTFFDCLVRSNLHMSVPMLKYCIASGANITHFYGGSFMRNNHHWIENISARKNTKILKYVGKNKILPTDIINKCVSDMRISNHYYIAYFMDSIIVTGNEKNIIVL